MNIGIGQICYMDWRRFGGDFRGKPCGEHHREDGAGRRACEYYELLWSIAIRKEII